MIFGPIIMSLNIFTDVYWFVKHLYKMDLDKTVTKKSKAEEMMELP